MQLGEGKRGRINLLCQEDECRLLDVNIQFSHIILLSSDIRYEILRI